MIFPLICTLSFVYTQEENTYKLHFSKVKTAEFLHFSKVKIAIILHFSKILHVFGNEYPEPKGTPQRGMKSIWPWAMRLLGLQPAL